MPFKRLILLFALLPAVAAAQYGAGNFGTQSFTTGPYSQCTSLIGGIQTITPSTPVSGQATMVLATNIGTSCTHINISFTNTDWDGASYSTVSMGAGNPQTIVITASQTDTYNSANFPNGYYAAQPGLLVDSGGTLWNFFKSCSNAEVSPACVADRKSTNGGATWTPASGQSNIFFDAGTHCNSGAQACDYRNPEVGYGGGNLSVVYSIHDATLATWATAQSSTCNPTSVDCTVAANWSAGANISLVPAGEPGGFFFCSGYGLMANLPGGALGATVTGTTTSAGCGGHIYLLISCDNGATWGTGTGCTGLKGQYAANPYRRITTPSGGYVVDPINNEMMVAYIGGTTLYGLARNNQFTSGCTSPCGQMIQWSSTNLGSTWSNALTNIGGYTPPDGTGITNYTEVSPVIFNANLGGLWMVLWGDRGTSTLPQNYTQNLLFLINPSNLISAPTTYPSVPTQYSYTPGLVLGGYPAVIFTGTGNQLLLQWDGSSPRISSALAIWQETANPILPNTLSVRGKSAKGESIR